MFFELITTLANQPLRAYLFVKKKAVKTTEKNNDYNGTRHKKMEPAAGFEPATDGLQNRSSTTELSWLIIEKIFYTINMPHFFVKSNECPFFFEKK